VDEGRFFAFTAGLAVLFWILSGQRAIEPRLRRVALHAAYASLAVGLLWAFLRTLLRFLG
jgi:hypothetical protein